MKIITIFIACIFLMVGCAYQHTITVNNGNSEKIFEQDMNITTILNNGDLNISIKNPKYITYSLDLIRESTSGKKHVYITENIYTGSVYNNLILYKLSYGNGDKETVSVSITDVNKGVEIYNTPILKKIK